MDIATLVERQARYVMLAKVAGKDTRTVVTALIMQAKKLPTSCISPDLGPGQGTDGSRRFTLATNIDVHFCDPQSPWQRGSNENTNGLLRQYFPQGTDLSMHSQAHLSKVARQLNERPRETLQIETPSREIQRLCCVDPLSPHPVNRQWQHQSACLKGANRRHRILGLK
jgi:IS30 family transposase